MAKDVPVEKLDEFCDLLFRAVDRADLLPRSLAKAPHAFEKYPRLLVGLLGRYKDVEAAFAEWETKALRSTHNSRRESVHPYFNAIRTWLVTPENRRLFEGENRKDNVNHLKRSLFGRLYMWLYPRRRLVRAYAQAHGGDGEYFTNDAIADNFQEILDRVQEETDITMSDATVADAQAILAAKRAYYSSSRWKSDEEFPVEAELEDTVT